MLPNGSPRSRRWIGSRCRRGELGLAAETLPDRLRSLPSLAGAGADRIALELGQPAEQGQHQTPCAVVVSAHASPSERKPAFFPAITRRVFSRSRVERARQSGGVTISTSRDLSR